MKMIKIWLVICISFIFYTCDESCNDLNVKIKQMMKNQYQKKLILKDSLFKLSDSFINKFSSLDHCIKQKKITIIHYIDSDCDQCIKELEKMAIF